MTTNKKMRSKRRHRHRHKHTNKMLKNKEKKEKSFSKRRHRRHHKKTTVSSWDKHYTYESNIVNSEVRKSDHNNKDDNEVQAVHGLKDFLQGNRPKVNLS